MLVHYPEAAHYEIDPARLDLVEEFRRSPRGPHGTDLQKLLHRMRWAGDPDEDGRYILLVQEPGRRWMLARLPRRRGAPDRADPQPDIHEPRRRRMGSLQAPLARPDRPGAVRPMIDSTAVLGYAWPLIVSPGESVAFHLSAETLRTADASIVRVRCADPDPAGPGLKLTTPGSTLDGPVTLAPPEALPRLVRHHS